MQFDRRQSLFGSLSSSTQPSYHVAYDDVMAERAIVEIKDSLSVDPRVMALVCTELAMEKVDETWRNSQAYGREARQLRVGYTACRWQQGLGEALALPGAEWPETALPPAALMHGLELARQVKRLSDGVID